MKRQSYSLAVLSSFVVTALTAGSVHAQVNQGGQVQPGAPVAPRTKIAVLNLQEVVKSYDKWNQFEKTYKDKYSIYNKTFEAKKTQGLQLKNQLAGVAADDRAREQIQAQLRQLDREVQDLGDEAQKTLGKQQDEMSVQIYKEIEEAVTFYARANDIEMVMHYNDATNSIDRFHPVNIQRKMQTGACMPVYMVPGMDITQTIASMLNTRMRAMQGGPGGAGAGAPGGQR